MAKKPLLKLSVIVFLAGFEESLSIIEGKKWWAAKQVMVVFHGLKTNFLVLFLKLMAVWPMAGWPLGGWLAGTTYLRKKGTILPFQGIKI